MILFRNIAKTTLLYEGLIYSVDEDTLIDRIGHWLKYSDKFSLKWKKSRKVQLVIINKLDDKEWEKFIKLINNLGWYITSYLGMPDKIKWIPFIDVSHLKNENPFAIELEAKFDNELNVGDYPITYHITQSKNNEKISRIGLVPKSKSKISYHPDRIYMSGKINNIIALADIFDEIGPYTIYKIDLKSAKKNDSAIRIFNDPNMNGAFYTLSNIPPQLIKIEKTIN
jgi:hypothetical protein